MVLKFAFVNKVWNYYLKITYYFTDKREGNLQNNYDAQQLRIITYRCINLYRFCRFYATIIIASLTTTTAGHRRQILLGHIIMHIIIQLLYLFQSPATSSTKTPGLKPRKMFAILTSNYLGPIRFAIPKYAVRGQGSITDSN